MTSALEQVESERRRDVISDLFSLWDLNGDGAVGFDEMRQVLQATNSTSKKQLKWVASMEAQIQNARGALSRRESVNPKVDGGGASGTALGAAVPAGGRRGSTHILRSGGSINFSDVDGEPSLDPEAFANFLIGITAKDTKEEFDAWVVQVREAVDAALDHTSGSQQKRESWEMFQLLDENHDGFVDLAELEVLLGAETKQDKKQLAKWRAYLINKARQGQVAAPAPAAASIAAADSGVVANDGTSPKGRPNFSEFDWADGQEETPEDRDIVKMTLAEFHSFFHRYVDNDRERGTALVASVRKAAQEKQIRYILEHRVHDILNDVMEDLLKERPRDVLAGIIKSAQRLERTGKFPKAPRRRSVGGPAASQNGVSLGNTVA